MAKSSSNAAPSFKAVPYKAPAPAPGARRAAANENFPVPMYLVMRTDWRFSKRSGRHQQQTTTVVSAFTTFLPAQEAALIAFEKFVNEYHYAGERSVENRFSWYSWWNGRNKAHYRDVKEIAEDMKTWTSKWKGATTEERYEKMVEAMEAVKSRLPSGSIFNVEKASLPPSARARAVNSTNPVPFRIFVLTENHWSWSKSVDVTTILGLFTCLNKARAEGVDAYHAYIHSSHQERKRLKWDKTANNAYDKMLKTVLAEKVTWEKTSREYGTSFSIDECYCYPRGAYFRHQDEVLPKAEEEINFPKAGGGSSMRSIPAAAPAAVPAPAQPVEQVVRASVVSSAPSASVGQKEQPYIPVVQTTDQDGPRAHGFIRRTYAVNPEKKREDRVGNQGIDAGAASGLQKKGILPPTRGSLRRGLGLGGERVRFEDQLERDARDGAGVSSRFAASLRSTGSSRFGSRYNPFDDDEEEKEQRRETHGEVQEEVDGSLKRRKTWNDRRPGKDEGESIGEERGEDVAQAWAQARARARARRAYAEDKDFGDDREDGDGNKNAAFEQRGVRRDDEFPAQGENVVYHRAYAYVARDKWRKEVADERKSELTSEGERADDEISVQAGVRRRVYERRRVDDQAEVQYTSEGDEVDGDGCDAEDSRPNEKSGHEDEEEVVSEVDHKHKCPVTGEACEQKIPPEGDDYQPDHYRMEKSEGGFEQARSEVDSQVPTSLTGKGSEGERMPEGRSSPLDNPLENEKTEAGHYNPLDDSFQKEKTGAGDEDDCGEVVDEPEDPPLVRKSRKPNEKISKYLDDQLKCLFTGEGSEGEIHTEGYGYPCEDPSSVRSSFRSEQPHSTKVHDWPERSFTKTRHSDKGRPKGDEAEQEGRVTTKQAGDVKVVRSEQGEDRHGYRFINIGYEGGNHAEGHDPPLIRKSRERKGIRTKGKDRPRGDAHHHADDGDYEFTRGVYGSVNNVPQDDLRPIRSGEQKEVRSKGDDPLRREARHQSDRCDHVTSECYGSANHAERRDIPPVKVSGEQKEVRSKGDDWHRGESSKRGGSHLAGRFADCEGDQLEDESVSEEIVVPRKEAPHLDLVLKRHHAFLKDNDSSEEEIGGRRPVGGGFKIPS